MRVEELVLYNFRNFSQLNLKLGPKVNIFLGKNGQGKTNLLESIYILAKGSSFRPSQVSTFINSNINNLRKEALAKAMIKKHLSSNEIKLKLEDQKKQLFINNKKTNSKQLFQQCPLILFSPESLAAIKEGPEQRRLLIDESLVLQNEKNQNLLNDFKKILKTRNKVLRDHKLEYITTHRAQSVLEPLNELYFPLAARLTYERISSLKQLQEAFSDAMRFISNDKDVDISVDYIVSSAIANNWNYEKILKKLLDRAGELQKAELDSGLSLVVPHKHDIQFMMSKSDSRYFCSQGQQRALILSFKMAQIMNYYRVFNDYPLLLLDDVLSELDKEKRTRLIEFLKRIDSQIFLTTTDLSFDISEISEDLAVFNINQGQVKTQSF